MTDDLMLKIYTTVAKLEERSKYMATGDDISRMIATHKKDCRYSIAPRKGNRNVNSDDSINLGKSTKLIDMIKYIAVALGAAGAGIGGYLAG